MIYTESHMSSCCENTVKSGELTDINYADLIFYKAPSLKWHPPYSSRLRHLKPPLKPMQGIFQRHGNVKCNDATSLKSGIKFTWKS